MFTLFLSHIVLGSCLHGRWLAPFGRSWFAFANLAPEFLLFTSEVVILLFVRVMLLVGHTLSFIKSSA